MSNSFENIFVSSYSTATCTINWNLALAGGTTHLKAYSGVQNLAGTLYFILARFNNGDSLGAIITVKVSDGTFVNANTFGKTALLVNSVALSSTSRLAITGTVSSGQF